MQIIASMTSIPSRIDRIRPAIESVLSQTVAVTQLELNIPYVCARTNERYELPAWLENIPRVAIFRTEDFGPITKIAPTLLRHRADLDTYVWSVDDDYAYPPNQLQLLYTGHDPGSYRILARHGGIFNPDGSVTFMYGQTEVGMFEGFGTVLYPPSCVGDDFEDYVKATSEFVDCRLTDDVVLSIYFHSRGVPIFLWNEPSDDQPFYPTGSLPYSAEADAIHRQGDGNVERHKRSFHVLKALGFNKIEV
jgi:hypothetical protein